MQDHGPWTKPSLTDYSFKLHLCLFVPHFGVSHHQFRYGLFSLDRGLPSLSRQMFMLKNMPVRQATKTLFTWKHPRNHQSSFCRQLGPPLVEPLPVVSFLASFLLLHFQWMKSETTLLESHNHWDWKRSLRSPNPTVKEAVGCFSL